MSKIVAIPAATFVLLLLTACSSGAGGGASNGSGGASSSPEAGTDAAALQCRSVLPELNKTGDGKTEWLESHVDIPLVSDNVREKSCVYGAMSGSNRSFIPTSALAYADYTKALAAAGYVDNHDGSWLGPTEDKIAATDSADLGAAGFQLPSAKKLLGEYFTVLATPTP